MGTDWSQFVPNLLVRLLVPLVIAIVGAVVAYSKSERFRKWLRRVFERLYLVARWLTGKWHIILLHSLLVLGVVASRIYVDWRILVFFLVCYAAGSLSWGLTIRRPILLTRSKSIKGKTGYVPISLVSSIGNSYLKSRYIAPPTGDVFLGKAQFRLEPDALIFDTNKQIRRYTPRDDGGKEIDLRLPEPRDQVKSAYFLINSSNSKSIYASQSIGEIRLVFRDAPSIVVELVLGKNIREWCPGNPGDFVREASSPTLVMDAWTGLSKNGANAVMDCLQIPVYECMRSCPLEKVIVVHKSLQRSPDKMGVHFSILAVSLEIAQAT